MWISKTIEEVDIINPLVQVEAALPERPYD